jgi:hypothetical protein
MGGFVRSALRLEWADDSEFAGLVVRVRRPTIGDRLWLDEPHEGKEGVFNAIDRLVGAILEWNVEDPNTGEPVPVTAEGLQGLDEPMIAAILVQWTTSTTTRRTPLPPTPTDGDLADIPMEPLTTEETGNSTGPD